MNRERVVSIVRAHEDELRQMGVESLAIFGSTVRDEATEQSDVDFVVDLAPQVGFFELVDLKERLQILLGRPVDLVPKGTLKRQLRDRVLAESEIILAA